MAEYKWPILLEVIGIIVVLGATSAELYADAEIYLFGMTGGSVLIAIGALWFAKIIIPRNTADQIEKLTKTIMSMGTVVSTADEIEKLAKLKDAEILTQEEFNAKKKQLLEKI